MSLRRLATAGYALAVLLWLIPLVDFVANVWPFRMTDAQWRYGSEGLLAGFLLTPFLGIALAAGIAAWREEGRVLRLLGWLAGLAAPALVVICGDFALNVLQVRGSVPAGALTRFDIGAAKAVTEYGMVAVAVAIASVALVRTGGSLRSDTPHAPLVVPRQPAAKS